MWIWFGMVLLGCFYLVCCGSRVWSVLFWGWGYGLIGGLVGGRSRCELKRLKIRLRTLLSGIHRTNISIVCI